MRKLLLVLFLGIVLSPLAVFAANTGTIKGKVVLEDKSSASGASIRVVGTNQGTKAKPDGKFTLVGVNVGRISLKISYLGEETLVELQLSANEIKDLGDVVVKSEKTMEEVVVVGNKIDLSRSHSGSTTSAAQLQSTARNDISSIVGATAGVQSTSDGYSIRGSRASESSIRLDGVEVSNPLNGGFGSGGTSFFPMPSMLGVAEVQVITGGFSAEYGEAMGGIVNTSMSVGSTERYGGAVKYRTSVGALWGSQDSKLGLTEVDGNLRAYDDGDGYKLESGGTNELDFAVNGPLPFTDKRGTFSLSGSNHTTSGNSGYHDIKDPMGNSLSDLDHNRSWVRRLDARFRYDITDALTVLVGGSYGISSWENNSWGWSYATSLGQGSTENYTGSIADAFKGVSENYAKQIAYNTKVMNLLARVKQTFPELNSYYTLTFTYNKNDDEAARRTSMDDPNFLTGFDLLEPQDVYRVENGDNGTATVAGSDQIVDQYYKYLVDGTSSDGYNKGQFPAINPFTGYYEGDESKNTNNPYGFYSSMTAKHANRSGFQYRKTSYWQLDGSYEMIVDNSKFKHAIKAGFDFRSYELHRHYSPSPWSESSSFDVYTDNWGGSFYIPEEYTAARALTSKPYEPIKASVYAQDQIQYKGIIFTPGLRVDYFDAKANYRTRTATFVKIHETEGFAEADPKIYVSPRIFVTYPLTETSRLDMSYGLFLKQANLQNMYDGFGIWFPTNGMVVGNPNMDAQRSSQYQISYENWLTEDLSVNITAYYKDIYNQLGTIYAQATPNPFYIYSTSEYGSSKGVEFGIEKQASDNIYASLNYALAWNNGTSPSAASNTSLPLDPYTDKIAFPLSDYAMSNDIRHNINFTLNFLWRNNEGPEVFGIQPLENGSIAFSGNWRSGYPYTRYKRSGEPVSDFNDVRQPSYWRLDLRLKKAFQLADWFGDAAGRTSIEFFLDINNLLNRTVATSLNSITGDPDDDGTSFYTKVSEMTSITFYKEADYTFASTFGTSQYDNYGDRLYTTQGDHNGDGAVTREEQYESYRQYLQDALSSRGNYQTPRTVYFGILLNF